MRHLDQLPHLGRQLAERAAGDQAERTQDRREWRSEFGAHLRHELRLRLVEGQALGDVVHRHHDGVGPFLPGVDQGLGVDLEPERLPTLHGKADHTTGHSFAGGQRPNERALVDGHGCAVEPDPLGPPVRNAAVADARGGAESFRTLIRRDHHALAVDDHDRYV